MWVSGIWKSTARNGYSAKIFIWYSSSPLCSIDAPELVELSEAGWVSLLLEVAGADSGLISPSSTSLLLIVESVADYDSVDSSMTDSDTGRSYTFGLN